MDDFRTAADLIQEKIEDKARDVFRPSLNSKASMKGYAIATGRYGKRACFDSGDYISVVEDALIALNIQE